MHSMLIILYTWAILLSTVNAITYSDKTDYDAYGVRIASTDHFVVLAQNDGVRYLVSMAPFGSEYQCSYNYNASNDFVINVAAGRRQNASQLSFVYLRTNSTDGYHQTLGLLTFSRAGNGPSADGTCNRMLSASEGMHDVKVWSRAPSELCTVQVDLRGNYAYGFLSKAIFIYDIKNSSVQDLVWRDVLSSVSFEPHALDVGETEDGTPIAVVAGYYQFDIRKTLPGVYLIRLNPPYTMSLIDNYTIVSDSQRFVREQLTSTYQFDYVMSVSIHDATQQVLVGIPQLSTTYLFSFDSAALTLIRNFSHPARSTTWLDDDGLQAGFLLSNVPTLPWAQSRMEVVNLSSGDVIHVYPNNQQTIEQWSSTPPTFLRLANTYDYQSVILTTDGTVLLVPTADAGYYRATGDISGERTRQQVCPSGTYKSASGPIPCTICPTLTRSSPIGVSSNSSTNMNIEYPILNCTACLSDSFCPLASVSEINTSTIQSISQAYAYPTSSANPSFDDILMQNTFMVKTTSRRCLLISPLFWALIALLVAFIVLLIMGILYWLPTGRKHFQRLQRVFRHSDLIGNGELWFGGLISFSVLLLIIYGFWFGFVFGTIYPIEKSTVVNFVCDTSLTNAQFSSSLQLLATIKSETEAPIFEMLDEQEFTMTVNFVQTGYTCDDILSQDVGEPHDRMTLRASSVIECKVIFSETDSVLFIKENVGTYSVTLEYGNCTVQPDNATLTISYRVPYHKMTIQINLTGAYYIGGVFICLTGPRMTLNDSVYVVEQMNYCQLFSTSNQTLGETTLIYFQLTKVINRTEALDYSGSTNYSGIWIPTSGHGSLNDRLAYVQRGAFLRYLLTQHTLIVDFNETPFFVMNKQEPIARFAEIIFHNILFTTTVLGIFALAFLVFKLTFMPIAVWIVKHDRCLWLCGRLGRNVMMNSKRRV